MIYFNKLKNACLQKIENPLCVITNELWKEFKYLTLGKDYDIIDGEFVDLRNTPEHIAEELAKAKENKQNENTAKANQAIQNGFVVFKEAQFETNTDTCSALAQKRDVCIARGDTSTHWLSKDDKDVEMAIDTENPLNDDFVKLGFVIEEFKNAVWLEKYLYFKAQIEQAETLEEVRSIEISYD